MIEVIKFYCKLPTIKRYDYCHFWNMLPAEVFEMSKDIGIGHFLRQGSFICMSKKPVCK